MSFHAIGESIEISNTLFTSPFSFVALSAVSGASFVLHKILEGFVLGVIALEMGVTGVKKPAMAGLVLVVLSLVGVTVGILSPIITSPFFAAGAAGWVFITALLGLRLQKERLTISLSLIM